MPPDPGSCGGGGGEIGPQTLKEEDVPHTQARPCSLLDPISRAITGEGQVGSCLPISHCFRFLSKPLLAAWGGGTYRAEPDSQGAPSRHLAWEELLHNSQAPSPGGLGRVSAEQFWPRPRLGEKHRLVPGSQEGARRGTPQLGVLPILCLPRSFSASSWTLPTLG